MIRVIAIFAIIAACMIPSAQAAPSPLLAWIVGLGVPAVLTALYCLATKR